jgi:hypothetical protein
LGLINEKATNMFERLHTAIRFGFAARCLGILCIGILMVSNASACDPAIYCSAIRVCSQAPAPWGPAITEATNVDDPNELMEKTEDCVRRSNFRGIGKYAKDWDRISDCGQHPERYLNFAHAAKTGACAKVR